MKETVLITGASGGIGLALANLAAQDGKDLILVARNEEKLKTLAEQLQKQYRVQASVFAQDLALPDAPEALHRRLQQEDRQVDILINNAGYGDFCDYLSADWARQRGMIDLNITALMQMSYLLGAEMRKRSHGHILNVASVAAFVPGPYMATYYASKAFVLSFSQALSEELKGSGVTVTALCPGPTTTGFESAAHLEDSMLFKRLRPAPAEKVAAMGYKAMMKGKAIRLCGASTAWIALGARLAPRSLVRGMVKQFNGVPPRKEGAV